MTLYEIQILKEKICKLQTKTNKLVFLHFELTKVKAL